MTVKRKVLVVDDSPTIRQMMVHFINRADDLMVVGEAADGAQAVDRVTLLAPDVVLMDVVMPLMDGLEATRQIMQTRPTPIVLVSASLEISETDIAFKALKAGALTVLRKPLLDNDLAEVRHLLSTLRSMSEVHVIHHFHRPEPVANAITPGGTVRPRVVAIAASTGGPAALGEILWNLPSNFTLPVVIVQHIAADFVPSLVGWLNHISKLPVRVAKHGEKVQPGMIHIAPGNGHLSIAHGLTFSVDPNLGAARYMPSGDILLESVARFYGAQAVGIVLTGMGDDGALGLQKMYQAGAFTIAQDEESSVVFGMPGSAIRLGAARQIIPLTRIARVLANFSS